MGTLTKLGSWSVGCSLCKVDRKLADGCSIDVEREERSWSLDAEDVAGVVTGRSTGSLREAAAEAEGCGTEPPCRAGTGAPEVAAGTKDCSTRTLDEAAGGTKGCCTGADDETAGVLEDCDRAGTGKRKHSIFGRLD